MKHRLAILPYERVSRHGVGIYADVIARLEHSLRPLPGALDRWVLERLQVLLDSGDKQAIALANSVDGGLVQLQEGAITKAELNEELRALVLEYWGLISGPCGRIKP